MRIHIVAQGDTMWKIAERYGVDLQQLIASNPQIADPDRLNVGDKVYVPLTKKQVMPNPNPNLNPKLKPTPHIPKEKLTKPKMMVEKESPHEVEESPQKYGLPEQPKHPVPPMPQMVAPIAPKPVHPKPIMPPMVKEPQQAGVFVKAEAGETLWTIAAKHHVTLYDLIAANPHIDDPDDLEPGIEVHIPVSVAVAHADAGPAPAMHPYSPAYYHPAGRPMNPHWHGPHTSAHAAAFQWWVYPYMPAYPCYHLPMQPNPNLPINPNIMPQMAYPNPYAHPYGYQDWMMDSSALRGQQGEEKPGGES